MVLFLISEKSPFALAAIGSHRSMLRRERDIFTSIIAVRKDHTCFLFTPKELL